MGIDCYLKFQGQTEQEKAAQITGFSVLHGHVGYLREAYHGEPYATRILMPEAFDESAEDGVEIPVEKLKERLPQAIAAVIERERRIYKNPDANENDPVALSYRNFVELYERLAREGKHPRVYVSW